MTESHREKRSSEFKFDRAFDYMRRLDKVLWYGDACMLPKVRIYVELIREEMESVLKEFEKEVEPQLVANRLKE